MFNNLKKYITKKEYIVLIIAGIASLILANGTNLILPRLISDLLDSFAKTYQVESRYYVITIIALILATIFTYLQTYINGILGEKIGKDLKDRLFKKLLKQNYNYLVLNKPSKILTIINNDTLFIKDTFIQSIGFILTAIFLLIGSIYLMYITNAKLATIIVITVPIIVITMVLSLWNKFKLFKKAQKLRDRLNKVINENIKASMLIKVFVSENTEIEKFKKVNHDNKKLGLKINNLFALVIPVIQTMNILGSVLIIYFGGEQILRGNMTIGQLTAFNSYVILFTVPMIILAAMVTLIGQSIASLKRINTLLDAPITFKNGRKGIKNFESLEFKNVYLNIDENEVLKDIDFKISKGEKVGIMGLTGSGKTVFLKQIIRAIEPTKGNIYFNGINIKEYKIEDILDLVGYTFQENFLFNGTVMENIKFGRNISDGKAIRCAKIAQVDSFVKNLKNGYNSNVGEQGNNLSGGQKQRIMIARALVNNPKLLILDDATSRLDISTEKKVMENIKKEFKDISIVIVSQKIYSIQDCDNIYIFDEGCISDSGKHKDLINSSVIYKEIELTQRNHEH